MRKVCLLFCSVAVLLCAMGQFASAARWMENLDRGVVAVSANGGVYVGWRMLGTDLPEVSFNVYRGTTKVNSTPITGSTNLLDTSGNTSNKYSVATVMDGVEIEVSEPVDVWSSFAYAITLAPLDGYSPNDASVGDLDGDGDYEIVLKRNSNDISDTSTTFNLIEAYHLDGTPMWRIDLGPNNLYGDMEINPIVYDFDNDGRAEIAIRTCEGNVDGVGNVIGDTDGDGITDYRSSAVLNNSMWMTEGPEFLSIFDGQTGEELARADYIERDPISQWGDSGMSLSQYAHRADKCMMTPAYLDGVNPSLIICRGIYARIKIEAWDYIDGQLVQRWTFDSADNSGYSYQGNHNLSVADVDGDGKDELIYASMCIDDDGTGLYTTELGHGDALHVSDMIPDRPGLEVFQCHEHSPYGTTLRDARTGEILFRLTADGDTGRCCAAHIDARYPGYQVWSSASGGTYNASDYTQISTNQPNWGNFLVYWDADLQRELLDSIGSSSPSPVILKWHVYEDGTAEPWRLLSLYNYPSQYASKCNNGTKGNPCLSADILGDWREEIICRSSDDTKLYIYTSTEVTDYRMYTLMHDSQYRTAIAWQCNMYNQPPHPSFYIGAGMDEPPVPNIQLVETEPSVFSTNPAAFAVEPTAESDTVVSMAAVEATSTEGSVEYMFTEITGNAGATSSQWQASAYYTDSGLEPLTKYIYRVRMRDSAGNISSTSSPAEVITNCSLDTAMVYYRFDGDSADENGVYDAVESGSPVYVDGVVGDQALSFDGSDDYLTLPAGIVDSDDITIACWYYIDTANTWQRIFDFGNGTSDYMFLSPNAYSSSGSMLRFAARVNSGTEEVLETSAPAAGTWVHVTVVMKGDVAGLFVNGVLADSGAFTINPTDINPTTNYIGDSQWSADPLFDGGIDDFRIYNFALSAKEITMISQSPSFTSNPIVNENGIEMQVYGGNPLSAYIDNYSSVSKVSGPEWLNISADGTLSGLPGNADVGENVFTIQADNYSGLSASVQLNVTVDNVYNGTQGVSDLIGLANSWLLSDCTDIPACDGADLDGDAGVTISDFTILAEKWMIEESLQLYLKFDGSGSEIDDSSLHNRSCQPVNGPAKDSAGYSSAAMIFDGIDDYLEVTDYAGVSGAGSRTVAAWVKPETSSAIQAIASWGKALTGEKFLIMVDSITGQLALATYGGRLSGGPDLKDGLWHHIAVVVPEDADNLNQVKMYVDGYEISTNADSIDSIIATAETENVLIGAFDYDATDGVQTPLYYFKGAIDDFRIYSSALGANDISNLADAAVE